MAESAQTETYEFALEKADLRLGEQDVRRLVEQAVQEAAEAMKREEGTDVTAQFEVLGAFVGVGTIAVTLLLGFSSGFAKKAGEDFYERYLAVYLRKKNLSPKDFKKRPSRGAGKR